ncbi:13074_t:CDS:2, partial [Racocetra persica]
FDVTRFIMNVVQRNEYVVNLILQQYSYGHYSIYVYEYYLDRLKDKKKLKHKRLYYNYEFRPNKNKPHRYSQRLKDFSNKKSNLTDENIILIAESALSNLKISSSPLSQQAFSIINCTNNASDTLYDSQPPSFIQADFFNSSISMTIDQIISTNITSEFFIDEFSQINFLNFIIEP